MRKLGCLLLLCLLPATSWAQSTFHFPLVVDAGPVGIAVVNPTSAAATVSYIAYSANGQQLGTGTQSVPAGGQVAKLGSELLASATNAKGGIPGWIQVSSAATGLQAFEMAGDFATAVAGIDAAPLASDQVIPVGGKTLLFVANPAATSISVVIRAYDAAGALVGTLSPVIPAKGVYDSDAVGIQFGAPGTWASARHLRIVSPTPVAVGADFKDFLVSGRDQAAITGSDAENAPTRVSFAHAVHGTLGVSSYTTMVGITNSSTSSQTVSITFNPESGAALSVQLSIPANGTVQRTLQDLFQLSSTFQSGWVDISGSAKLNAFLAYADVAFGGVAVVPAQATARTTLLFAHTANLSPWWTGVAILNTGATDATVEISGMNPDGTLAGSLLKPARATIVVPARSRTAKLIEEIMPAYQSRQSDGGFLFLRSTSNVPLIGIELFFLRSGAAIANVAAGTLLPGINFTPPPPADRFVTIAFWSTNNDCSGNPGSTNRFPVSYGSEQCYTWPGRSGENSATNFSCGANSMSYTQWTTLTCSGGQNPPGTRKTTYTDRCTQDVPPTLYARIVDFSGCPE